jgi:hypothetical protein
VNDTTLLCGCHDPAYCQYHGFCNPNEDGCLCSDPEHYWPSDRCSTYHDGSELGPGRFCSPNAVDAYCSFMRWGNPALASTLLTVDRLIDSSLCDCGDRSYCNFYGFCAAEKCVCDDPQHFGPLKVLHIPRGVRTGTRLVLLSNRRLLQFHGYATRLVDFSPVSTRSIASLLSGVGFTTMMRFVTLETVDTATTRAIIYLSIYLSI